MSMLMVMLFGGKSDKKNPFLNNGRYPSQQIGSEEGVESSLVPFNNYIPTTTYYVRAPCYCWSLRYRRHWNNNDWAFAMYQNSSKNFLAKYPNTLHIHHSSFFAFFLLNWAIDLQLQMSNCCWQHLSSVNVIITRPGGTVLKLVGTINCKIRQRCKTITMQTNVSYVMEFLSWWVLKSKVFAQKSKINNHMTLLYFVNWDEVANKNWA